MFYWWYQNIEKEAINQLNEWKVKTYSINTYLQKIPEKRIQE